MRSAIEMAREAGFMLLADSDPDTGGWWECFDEEIEKLVDLVRADEREAMMQLFTDPENQPTQHGTVTLEYLKCEVASEREACEALYAHEDVQAPVGNSAWGEAYQDGWIAGAQAYRDAIRARGNT
jgi:uncharacterized protein (DUF169 family)